MNSNNSSRNRISLPAIGAEVFTYLKDLNDRESFTATRRLKDLLGSNLKIELSKYFDGTVVSETSQVTLRKITNSLLSAGTSGHNRTIEALKEIRLESGLASEAPNYNEITRNLRDWSHDYRSAKGALDNNFKCINSFLRVQKTPNDETVKLLLRQTITSYPDFTNWNNTLKEYWTKKEIIKSSLQGAYLAIYESFISSFEEDLTNSKLYFLLDSIWLKYLSDEQKSKNIEANTLLDVDISQESVSQPSGFSIELEIEQGSIKYLVNCFSFNAFQASQLQFKLALELSRARQFPTLNFRVNQKTGDFPVIAIAVQGLQDESDISNIVQFLETTLERAKTTH